VVAFALDAPIERLRSSRRALSSRLRCNNAVRLPTSLRCYYDDARSDFAYVLDDAALSEVTCASWSRWDWSLWRCPGVVRA
jgi:hypothetical protein